MPDSLEQEYSARRARWQAEATEFLAIVSVKRRLLEPSGIDR